VGLIARWRAHRQFEFIRRVIRNDATLSYRYTDGKGNTCVIGGLAVAKGIAIPQVGSLENEAAIERTPGLVPLLEALRWAYPVLQTHHLASLQWRNDHPENRAHSYYSVQDRRNALLAIVDDIERGKR
jgi:hypothetical protein